MVGIQGLVLLTTRSGGSQAAVGSALVYAVLSLAMSVVLLVVMRQLGTISELVSAEAAQWRAGAVLSGVLAVHFVLAVVLGGLGIDTIVAYIDPVLVLTAAGLLLPTPVRMVRSSPRELLEAAPDPSVTAPVAGMPRCGRHTVYRSWSTVYRPAGMWTAYSSPALCPWWSGFSSLR